MSLYIDGKKIYNSLVVDGDVSSPIVLLETATGQTYTFSNDFEGYVLIVGRDAQTFDYDAPTINVQYYYTYFGNVKVYPQNTARVTIQKTFIYCKAKAGDTITISDYYSDGEFYLFKSVNNELVFDEYLEFNDECIDTPIPLSSNHRVFVDFQYNSFLTQMQLIGNTAGNTSNFYGGGLWSGTGQNRFYVRTTNGEQNTILSDYTTRHTLDVNNEGKIYIDGDYWIDGTQNTNASVNYTIGYRGAEHKFIGKIYRFFIYDNSSGKYLLDMRPAHIGNTYGMYDIVSGKLYTKQPR